MSKKHNVMSFQAIPDPLTGVGVRLGEPVALITPRFHIHECGFLPQGTDGWEAETVISPFWRLWYTMSEGHWMESNGVRLELGPQRLVFAPAQLVFSTGSRCRAPQLWLHFSLIPDYAFEARDAFDIPMDALLHEQVKAVINAHCTTRDNSGPMLYHYAAALLHNCFALHPLLLRALPEALRSILHDIESAPAGDLSNAHLARCANMSMSNFIRWFKQYMNQSPASYVHQVRLRKASWMLLFSDLSIGQIATEVGFSNRDYFSRAFIHHAGCGPATFRKKQHALTRK